MDGDCFGPYSRASQRQSHCLGDCLKKGMSSENDIPSSIKAAQGSHADVEMVYAWPFQVDAIAGFLARHMEKFTASGVSER